MDTDTPPSGVTAAAAVLLGLLTTRKAYRREWERLEQRRRSEKISYAAVARVLGAYLQRVGEKDVDDGQLHRRLKDRVGRALEGKKMTHETLTWFLEAFDVVDEDRETVLSAFSGGSASESFSEGITFTLRDPKPLMNRVQWHRSVALFRQYHIGSDKMLHTVETRHVIVALEDGVDMYGQSYLDNLKELRCIAGGKRIITYPSAPGFIGIDIELEQPLRKGQPASLEYVATYHPTASPRTEVRRAARARIKNVDMRVCFEGILPKRAWWCVWDDHVDGSPIHSEEIDFKAAGQLHRFVPYMEQAVAGFRWEWD